MAEPKSKRPKLRTFYVWTEQVNQMKFTVKARDIEEAKRKVYRIWRQGEPRITYWESNG